MRSRTPRRSLAPRSLRFCGRSATGRPSGAAERRAQRLRRRAGRLGVADRPHDPEPLRARRRRPRRVRRVDPADREERVRRGLGGVGDELEADARAALFGRRLPDRPDADVVDRQPGRGARSAPRSGSSGRRSPPGRAARGPRPPRRRPGRRGRRRRAGLRQLGVVVDDEEGAVGVAEAAEGERGELDLAAGQRLLAQLDDVDAAAERRAQERLGVAAARVGVADEVEARGAQPLAAQRSDRPPVVPGSSSDYHPVRARAAHADRDVRRSEG